MRGGVITGTAIAGEPQGALTLPRALIAARTGDLAAADEQPGRARTIAVRLAAAGSTVTRASAQRR